MSKVEQSINEDIVENLAAFGHTPNDIADILSCSRKIITQDYAEAYRRGLGHLRHDTRKHLRDIAFGGKGVANMKALHKMIDMIFPQINNPNADPYGDNIYHATETIRIEFIEPNATTSETETTIPPSEV